MMPMSTVHVPPVPARSPITTRSGLIALVATLIAVALAAGILAATGALGTSRTTSAPGVGHLAPALQYPGTGQAPSVRVHHATSATSARHLPPAIQYPGTGQSHRVMTP
jgi:hypothetical protein